MSHSLLLAASAASSVAQWFEEIGELIQGCSQRLADVALTFLAGAPSPAAAKEFEEKLEQESRELNRQIVQWAYNRAEADGPETLPHDIRYQGDNYRRLNRATANSFVGTLFGVITLRRHGYRSWQRDDGLPTIFPRELQFGLVEGATPALLDRAGRYMAEAGATQQLVLSRLREQHSVNWGVKRLRQAAATLAERLEPFRREVQVRHLLELLKQAEESKGRCRPSLSVGRDGITLWTLPHGLFEVATSATLTVIDRSGRRLGTAYLAYAPQLGQGQMTDELTGLLTDLLAAWQGPLPRLCYVTDAGDHETAYYKKVLRKMRHPRTGKPLEWCWIVDFYHAAARLTTMAEAIFGEVREAAAWSAKMRKLLKQPNGAARVLWSAAKLRANRGLRSGKKKDFEQAYNYLRTRTKHLRYAECQRLGLPLGSGITEAACKTIYASRLKLSGMRWTNAGAQTILTLRIILLSGAWTDAYAATLTSDTTNLPQPITPDASHPLKTAA